MYGIWTKTKNEFIYEFETLEQAQSELKGYEKLMGQECYIEKY